MYYPYFRGKQNELITIRDNAEILKTAGFIPIIEPVKEAIGALTRALDEVIKHKGDAIVIINPAHGNCDVATIQSLFANQFHNSPNILVGVLVGPDDKINEIDRVCTENKDRRNFLIHRGYPDGKELAESLKKHAKIEGHAFLESSGKLYQRHFKGQKRVLIRDGFQRRPNREHPRLEFFSDLHVTYEDEGMDGFGDFLIVGDEFSEAGGPAYAVAIHVTFIDPTKDDAMYIHHFVSDRTDTPTDPAGKFAEALRKLTAEAEQSGTAIHRTKAISEFLDLGQRGHFPGLGYLKKLSMQHHMETLAAYFSRA